MTTQRTTDDVLAIQLSTRGTVGSASQPTPRRR